MPKADIGIVVPTLNSAATLDWTLCCLRHQRDTAVELIVADSGSNDGTLEICEKWGVPTLQVPAGNMYRAINEGLRQLNTDWMTYLNSDDVVYPYSYARLLARAKSEGAAAVYGDCDFMDFEGRFLYALRSAPPALLLGLFQCGVGGFAQPAVMFSATAFRELGGFDERFRLISDFDFFSRMSFGRYAFARLERPAVASFRRHAGQLSTSQAEAMKQEMKLWHQTRDPNDSIWDWLSLLTWRLQNSSCYAWRVVMNRSWQIPSCPVLSDIARAE